MPSYQFGPFAYDPQTGTLSSSETQQLLRHQVNRLLFLLIHNRERVLTRDDILAEIWPGEYVEPNNFFQCVNHLRKALGEQADTPRYFRNYRGKGYRWICPVEEIRAAPHRRFTAMSLFKSWQSAALAGCVLFVLAWVIDNIQTNSTFPAPGIAHRESAAGLPVSASNQGDPLRAVSKDKRIEEPFALEAGHHIEPLSINAKKGQHMKVFARARKAYLMGEIPHCETLLTMAGARAREMGDSESEAMADLALARIGRYRDPSFAKTKALRVKRLSGELGHDVMYFEACYRLVLIYLDLDEIALANQQLQESRFLASIKTARQRATAKLAEGVLALRDNRMARAEAILKDLKTLPLAEMGDVIAPKAQLLEAALLFARSQFDLAAAKVNQARDLFLREGKYPLLEIRTLWLSCQIETMRGNSDEADRLHARTAGIADRYRFQFFKEGIDRFQVGSSWLRDLEMGADTSDTAIPPVPGDEPMLDHSPARFFNL